MKRKTGRIFMSLLLVLCMCYSLVATALPALAVDAIIISNPYATVDWSSYGQYKADFHAHSTNSDGGNLMRDMVEDHYAKGYDILAMTDHNYLTLSWNLGANGVTNERVAEINAGVGRDGRGMIDITKSDEQSLTDHINSFFADFNNSAGATMAGTISAVENLGGITHINHPGRYTGGSAGGEAGIAASNNSTTVQKYVDLFTAYPSCVGMEIINKIDNESRSDRVLWDNILKQMMPTGRFVWGFSNDDTHSINATGYSWNVMLMPSLSPETTRTAMETGAFYAVSRVSRPDGINATLQDGGSMPGSGNSSTLYLLSQPTPGISNIDVDEEENTITITGQNYDTVEWIADGVTIATGNTIDIDNYADQINSYVRAQLKSSTGIAFTQPFGVTGLDSVQAAPTGLAGIAPTTVANDDGMITGTTTAMEYMASGDSVWTACLGTEITGLAVGNYDVRYAATATLDAGPAATVTVPAYVAYIASNITFQPGSDETSMNFTWYSNVMSSTSSYLELALTSAMTDAASFPGTITDSNGFKSNEVSVTGLSPNTVYFYRLGDGTNFSEVYSFKTHDLTSFYNAILVGDPQIGSGGTLNGMTGWQNTVTQALTNFSDTSFILSAGDQVNTSSSEDEYTGFFSPAELTSTPLVPAIGNHDTNALYAKHYNSPNESTTYGTTSGVGGDYWFTYGNTLYMVLNSNNQSATSHDAFMQEAINAAGSGIVWKVVMFHHAIYSSASHSTDSGIQLLRSYLYPIFDKYDIDVVLNGHDHAYTRTFQMEGGVAQNGVESAVTNPVGTLYITANSGSGSKYYDLKSADTGYMAARWQGEAPSYSNVIVTDNSFTITTYRSDRTSADSDWIIDTYTINKTQSTAPTGLTGVEPTTLDNNDGKITGTTAAMEYKRTTQTAWTACTDTETTNLFPGVYDVRYGGTTPGVSTIITILPFGGVNQDQAVPENLVGINPTTADNNDGQITGTTTAMEYRTSGAPSWTVCAGSAITGLIPGNYEIRYMAKPGFNAGPSTYISIALFSAGGAKTIMSRINNGNDDVEEFTSDQSMYMNSSDLEFMTDEGKNQIVGLRFTDLEIPVGAKILNAYIQLSVDESINSDPFNVAIVAQKIADAPAFTSSTGNVSGRDHTSALAYWSGIPQWTQVHSTVPVKTPDLSAVVQEVIDLDGWVSGNAIAFGFAGEGVRIAESFEGAGSNADQIPTLYITFEYIPPTGDLIIPIASELDDMEELPDGSLDWNSSDLEITRENSENNQQIGLRFDNLMIPQGAVITDAYIQFSVDEAKNSVGFDVKIYAENTVDSAPFENENYTVSSRLKSSSFATWKDIAPWTVEHEAGELEATPNLSSLIQEIVDNGSWKPGNAISFILAGEGQRTAESFEGAGTHTDQIPTLYLSYTMIDTMVQTARDALVAEMESGKYTHASVSAAQIVVDEVNTAINDGSSGTRKDELLAAIAGASDGLVLINQAKLQVAPNTILSGNNRSIVFSVTVEQLQDVDVMEGFVKISDDKFEITKIMSMYTESNVIYTKNLDFYNDGTTGYFSLAKVGGFDDMAKMDVVEITITLKDGVILDPENENSLEAVLDSITMYIGNSENFTAVEVYSAVVGDGSALTHLWLPSEVKGDISGDKKLTGIDLAIAITFFGKSSTDMGDNWYASGAWMLDFNKVGDSAGMIDISDLTVLARLIANQNN